eukprot:6148807-Prymnesium_polylepis.1
MRSQKGSRQAPLPADACTLAKSASPEDTSCSSETSVPPRRSRPIRMGTVVRQHSLFSVSTRMVRRRRSVDANAVIKNESNAADEAVAPRRIGSHKVKPGSEAHSSSSEDDVRSYSKDLFGYAASYANRSGTGRDEDEDSSHNLTSQSAETPQQPQPRMH